MIKIYFDAFGVITKRISGGSLSEEANAIIVSREGLPFDFQELVALYRVIDRELVLDSYD